MGGELHDEGRDIHEDRVITPLDTSFRYTAEEDAALIMDMLFSVDMFAVKEGASEIVISNDYDEEIKVTLRADQYGDLVSERTEGGQFTLALIDFDEMKSTIAAIAKTIRSESYIDGRLDQWWDLIGSNNERAVKAKDLGKVYDDSCLMYESEVEKKNAFLDSSKKLRRLLQIIPIKDENNSRQIVFRRKTANGEKA